MTRQARTETDGETTDGQAAQPRWDRPGWHAAAAPRRRIQHGFHCLLGLTWAALLLLPAPPAAAQMSRDPEDLAQAVYSNPSDLDLGYEYAHALLDAGQYQQAAAELERMLIIEPDQPRLRLELGVLYFRLGSYNLAQSYLRRSLDTPGLAEPVRERVRYYLDAAERRGRPSQIAGSVSFGYRHQSNANGGVSQDIVSTLNGPVLLPPNLRQRSDSGAYLMADLTHAYELGLRHDETVVTNLGLSATRQTSPDFFNFMGLSVRSGLRFAPAPIDLPGLRLFAYIRGESAFLNDSFYDATIGPGLELSFNHTDRLVTSLALEQRFATYDAVPNVEQAHLLSGNERLAMLRVGYSPTPFITLFAQAGVRGTTTQAAWFDFTEYQAGGGMAAVYPAPVTTAASAFWNVTTAFAYYWRCFGQPDPLIDPGRTRSEREWRIRLLNEIPLLRSWSVVQQVEYARTNANLPNYDRDNLIVSVGLSYRF